MIVSRCGKSGEGERETGLERDRGSRDRLEWHSVKPRRVCGAMAVFVRDGAHLGAGAVEELVLLGASFSCAGFVAVGTLRQGVFGEKTKQLVVEPARAAGFAARGMEGIRKVAHSVERTRRQREVF